MATFPNERADDANFGGGMSRGTRVMLAKFGEIQSNRFREMLSGAKSQDGGLPADRK